jgi:hypothetical protein
MISMFTPRPTWREEWIKYKCMFVLLNYWIFVLLYYCNFHVDLPPVQVYVFIDPMASHFFVAYQKGEVNKIWMHACLFKLLNICIAILLWFSCPIQVYALIDPEASYFFVAHQKREVNKIWIYVCLFKLLHICAPGFLYFYFTNVFGPTKIFFV